MKNLFYLTLLLLLLIGYTIPTIATIELCRCTANFEQFYDSPHYDDDHSKTSESIRYPYNYNDHYIDTDGFVIVEGIRVLSDRSTACAHGQPTVMTTTKMMHGVVPCGGVMMMIPSPPKKPLLF